MLYNNQLKHTAPFEISFKNYVYTVYTDGKYHEKEWIKPRIQLQAD